MKRSSAFFLLLALFSLPDYHKFYTVVRHALLDDVPLVSPDKVPSQHAIPVNLELQGNNNGCGSTSLAMGANAVDSSLQLNRPKVDQAIRRMDIWTTPDTLVRAAHTFGLRAELYNESSFEEIQKHLVMGNPVIALVNLAGKDDFSAHYEVISGYKVHPDGKKELDIVCPARGRYSESFEAFQSKWEDVQISGVSTGYDRLIIVLSDSKLPPSRKPYSFLGNLASRCADVLNTSTSVSQGDVETLVSKDLPNGNLFIFALVLAGLCNLISPKRAQALSQTLKQLPQDIKDLPKNIRYLPGEWRRMAKTQCKQVQHAILSTPLGFYLFYLLCQLTASNSQKPENRTPSPV